MPNYSKLAVNSKREKNLNRKYFVSQFYDQISFSFFRIEAKEEFFGDLTLLQTVFIPFNLVLNYGSEANRSPSPCLLQMEAVEAIRLGFSKQTKQSFSSNRNKLKQDLFWLCFGLFREKKFCLFLSGSVPAFFPFNRDHF